MLTSAEEMSAEEIRMILCLVGAYRRMGLTPFGSPPSGKAMPLDVISGLQHAEIAQRWFC